MIDIYTNNKQLTKEAISVINLYALNNTGFKYTK